MLNEHLIWVFYKIMLVLLRNPMIVLKGIVFHNINYHVSDTNVNKH